MFSVVLRKSDRVRRYAVSALDDTGWQVTRENDGEPPRQIFYHDWHRLERGAPSWSRGKRCHSRIVLDLKRCEVTQYLHGRNAHEASGR